MTVYAIHNDNGVLVSVGTIVAAPLPAGLTAVQLTNQDAVGLRDGTHMWDTTTRTVVARPVDVTVTVTADLLTKAEQALAGNATFLAIGSPTNAQTLAQVRALTRETTAVIKLLCGEVFGQRDKLADSNGT